MGDAKDGDWLSPRGSCGPCKTTQLVAIAAVLVFSGNSEIFQLLQERHDGETVVSPSFNLWVCHIAGFIFIPWAYKSLLAKEWAYWKNALIFSGILMLYNWLYVKSSTYISVAMVNAIFQSNVAFCCFYEGFRSGELSVKKSCAALLCVLGAMAVAFCGRGDEPLPPQPEKHDAAATAEPPPHHPYRSPLAGGIIAFGAALGYAGYQCLFSVRMAEQKSAAPVQFCVDFGCAISIVHIVVILPLLFVVSAVGLEQIVVPPLPFGHTNNNHNGAEDEAAIDWLLIALTATLAFFVNLAQLYVLYMGDDPSMMAVTMSLSIPASLAFDYIKKGAAGLPSPFQVVGHMIVLGSVVIYYAKNVPCLPPDEHPHGYRSETEAVSDVESCHRSNRSGGSRRPSRGTSTHSVTGRRGVSIELSGRADDAEAATLRLVVPDSPV